MNELLRKESLKLKFGKGSGLIVELSGSSEQSVLLDRIAAELFVNNCRVVWLRSAVDVTDVDYYSLALKVKHLCRESDATFVVDGRADYAFVLEADAIVFSKECLGYSLVKEILPENILRGRCGFGDSELDDNYDFVISYDGTDNCYLECLAADSVGKLQMKFLKSSRVER